MPRTRKKAQPAEEIRTRPCDVPGCGQPGEYRAPYSKDELNRYRWFCLDHVREYNRNWDYFSGMDAYEIEGFMKDAMLGHRPTWKINQALGEEKLAEAIHRFRFGEQPRQRRQPPASHQSTAERQALAVLNLEGEVSLQEIKKQYKLLVKKHHPDVNRDNRQAEERFKAITEAYQVLMKIGKEREG